MEELAIVKRYKTNNLFKAIRAVVEQGGIVDPQQVDMSESLLLCGSDSLTEGKGVEV